MTAEQLVDLREAERDAALNVLERLVATRKGFEFATTAEQQAWREARALLVEHGRRVGREGL
jgi:hypothetical protein